MEFQLEKMMTNVEIVKAHSKAFDLQLEKNLSGYSVLEAVTENLK